MEWRRQAVRSSGCNTGARGSFLEYDIGCSLHTGHSSNVILATQRKRDTVFETLKSKNENRSQSGLTPWMESRHLPSGADGLAQEPRCARPVGGTRTLRSSVEWCMDSFHQNVPPFFPTVQAVAVISLAQAQISRVKVAEVVNVRFGERGIQPNDWLPGSLCRTEGAVIRSLNLATLTAILILNSSWHCAPFHLLKCPCDR